MEEKTIVAVSAVRLGVIRGAISAILGLIAGIIFAAAGGSILVTIPGMEAFTGIIGLIAVAMPIVGLIGGFIEGLIIAALYNLLAPRTSGIKLRFE